MFPIFNILLAPFTPLLWVYTLHRRFIQRKSAQSFHAQWGHISPEMRAFGKHDGPKIWLHAVSVGETITARPIARALKREIPDLKIALSSTTDAGHEVAQTILEAGEVDCCFYFPLDLAPVVSRVLSALRPGAICFVETELWPNLLHLARKRRIETYLVNGRVSDNLLRTAPKLGPLWKWMSGNVSRFLMRDESDANRLETLGIARAKIEITGDVKLESPFVDETQTRQMWRERLDLSENARLLVAGSTHPGEEAMMLEAIQDTDWRLALAPRHVERAEEVAMLIERAGFAVVRRSSTKPLAPNAVYLLDSVGELGDFYAAGEAAFVGGSLIARGGHNLLEPVLRGVKVFFGPHVDNFRAAETLVLENELGARVSSTSELREKLLEMASSTNDFAVRRDEALAVHRGAATRMARIVARVFSE